MAKKKKYKLSRKYMNEFFGLFGVSDDKAKQTKLGKAVQRDPELRAIGKEIEKLNKQAVKRVKDDEEMLQRLRSIGIDPDDLV